MIKKLFPMIKEIISKTGILHFRRWRIWEIAKFRIYLHNILESDQDAHEHGHPWNFCSIILKGGYIETSLGRTTIAKPGSILIRDYLEPHKITKLFGSTWTLVIAWGPHRDWGYLTSDGWIDSVTYRKMKNDGSLQA